MMLKSSAILLLLAAIWDTSSAWTTLPTSKVVPGVTSQSSELPPSSPFIARTSQTTLFETSSEENIPKRKRKRKKKVQVVDVEDVTVAEAEPVPAEPETPPVLDLKPREDVPVQLEVKNILASNSEPKPSAIASISSMLSSLTSLMGSNDSSGSGESRSASSSATSGGSSMGNPQAPLDSSLDQLLEDVRLMTEEEKDAKSEGGVFSDAEGKGVKEMIGNALSTIVTADFFVVCGFLVWFLVGIFCSSILKDDTIQIAFNNNFETLVQPALGVLMIAAIGGNFFKEEEQEYDL